MSLPLSQASHLVVDEVDDALRVPQPVGVRRRIGRRRRAAVADEHGVVLFPDRLEPEVVVDAAVGQEHVLGERRLLEVRAGAGDKVAVPQMQPRRRQHRRKRRRGADRHRELNRWTLDLADAPVPHVRLRKAPEHAGLHVGRVDHEPWGVGEILKRRPPEKEIAVTVRDVVGRRAREKQPLQRITHIERPARQRPQRRDDFDAELRGHAVGERQPSPLVAKDTRRNRSTRHAGDARQPREVLQFVQTPQRAEMEQHRPIAAARQAQPDTWCRDGRLVARKRPNGRRSRWIR